MKNNVISKRLFFGIVAASLFFDALSALPLANVIVAAVGQFTMALLFRMAGIDVLRGKPAGPFAVTALVEAVPALGSLPLFFLQAVVVLLMSGKRLR